MARAGRTGRGCQRADPTWDGGRAGRNRLTSAFSGRRGMVSAGSGTRLSECAGFAWGGLRRGRGSAPGLRHGTHVDLPSYSEIASGKRAGFGAENQARTRREDDAGANCRGAGDRADLETEAAQRLANDELFKPAG